MEEGKFYHVHSAIANTMRIVISCSMMEMKIQMIYLLFAMNATEPWPVSQMMIRANDDQE